MGKHLHTLEQDCKKCWRSAWPALGGTGLGLYIVQEIVAAHGGQLTVQSSAGYGTTFTITLPRSAGKVGTDG